MKCSFCICSLIQYALYGVLLTGFEADHIGSNLLAAVVDWLLAYILV